MIEHDGSPIRAASREDIVQEVRASLGGSRTQLLIILAVMVAAAAAGLIVPLALGRVADAVVAGRPASVLAWIAGLVAAGVLFQAGLASLGLVGAARLLDRIVASFRERLVQHVLSRSSSALAREIFWRELLTMDTGCRTRSHRSCPRWLLRC